MPDRREKILSIIREVSQEEITEIPNSTPSGVIVKKEIILSLCERLHHDSDLYFDMLSCVTGVDNGSEAGTMEVIYHLYSIPFNQSLVLKVILPRESPELESIVSVWNAANWLEREVYDMFGIQFNNHPDLRRILMPADWKGYPLRKDYKHEEYYRGVKIEY
jgi:NADH-quinone oxidoreductase subunit C